MKNKTALITGASSGIGFETAKGLALKGYDLILIVRTQSKAEATLKQLKEVNAKTKIDTYLADLNDMDSIKRAAKTIQEKYSMIDCLICNAGFGPDKVEFNTNGLEQSFVTNHLGHFVLVNSLISQVEAAEDGRIINVASSAYQMGKVDRMFVKNNKNMNALQAYGDGKLANVLFTKALMSRLKKSTTFSLHPGVVKSGFSANYTGFFKLLSIMMRPFMISSEQGAQTSIYLATTPLKDIKPFNGEFFVKSKPVKIKSTEVSNEKAEWLWEKSKLEVGL